MKNVLSQALILIIIVALTIFVQRRYFPNIQVKEKPIEVVDTFYQDTGSVEYIPRPFPVYKDTVIRDTVKLPADSAQLAELYLQLYKEFHSYYTYKDTLRDNDTIFISLETEISENKPYKYNLTYYSKVPKTIKKEYYHSSFLYGGVTLGKNTIAPKLGYMFKNDFGVEAGYNIQENEVLIGVNYKLFEKW